MSFLETLNRSNTFGPISRLHRSRRIEETLWAIHEANIQDLFETYEQPKTTKDGEIETDQNAQMRVERKERPRLISDLAPEITKLIEDVTADSNGRLIPRFYSKLQASKELRAMLNISRPERESDMSRLSDAELIAQLADQAKELGIEIDLNYQFAQPSSAEQTDGTE